MDELAVAQIKDDLDKILAERKPSVGIAFGVALFEEFNRRGWFRRKDFDEWGRASVYKDHLAFIITELPASEFRVGNNS